MVIRRTMLQAALVAGFALAAGASALAADPHHHAHGKSARLAMDHGKPWPTDEPLRRNMSDIRAALAARQADIHKRTLPSADYKALGSLVEARVTTIVGECKLEPAADANLHLIVAELMEGAQAMQGQTRAVQAAGASRVIHAVNQYGRYFNHPGWKPLG